MTDTPTPNPWANRIPRTAAEWVDHDLHHTQRHFEWSMENLKQLCEGDPRDHVRNIESQIAQWVNIYLWEALRRYAPHVADAIADDIANACEAGDAMGEWLWDWQRQHAAGHDLRLPFELAKS